LNSPLAIRDHEVISWSGKFRPTARPSHLSPSFAANPAHLAWVSAGLRHVVRPRLARQGSPDGGDYRWRNTPLPPPHRPLSAKPVPKPDTLPERLQRRCRTPLTGPCGAYHCRGGQRMSITQATPKPSPGIRPANAAGGDPSEAPVRMPKTWPHRRLWR
jgi:hypothetical protein